MEKKKLYRSTTDKKIAGVCGGVAEYFDIDVTLIRLAVALITLFSAGTIGLWIYIIAAIILPQNPGYTPYQDVNNQHNPYNNQQPPYNNR